MGINIFTEIKGESDLKNWKNNHSEKGGKWCHIRVFSSFLNRSIVVCLNSLKRNEKCLVLVLV